MFILMTDHAPMKLEKHYNCWIERVTEMEKKSVVLFLHLIEYVALMLRGKN